MRSLDLSSAELSDSLLSTSSELNVCVLDSCGVGYLGSHLMIAGIKPVEIHELWNPKAEDTLKQFEELLRRGYAAVFTISYDLGRKLQPFYVPNGAISGEPDIFVALFNVIAVHDYASGTSHLRGDEGAFEDTLEVLPKANLPNPSGGKSEITSDLTRNQYIHSVEIIKELICRGDTYQTNLTQQFKAKLPYDLTSESIFARLRLQHPAPFSAFIRRKRSVVVSASPERFFKIEGGRISTSPIKGTRRRGSTATEDAVMLRDLVASEKDRAENTMIVDLLRNDLGRVCEFGSVAVEKLCEIETHPTFHHLVSTISGDLKRDAGVAEVLRALLPCGSITGAPKIRTMEIIDEIERFPRGLSMGAIGYYIPQEGFEGLTSVLDLSVAIRTMVILDGEAVFNVGGGITIESDPQDEYEESMIKAKALFAALGN